MDKHLLEERWRNDGCVDHVTHVADLPPSTKSKAKAVTKVAASGVGWRDELFVLNVG